jgi:hypothetical protein
VQQGAKVHLAQNSSGRYNAGSCSKNAHVAELVDAHGSGPCAVRCGGSSPSVGTIYRISSKENAASLDKLAAFFHLHRSFFLFANDEKLSLTKSIANGYDACLGAAESPKRLFAHVAELVDAHGSGPCAVRCGGSSPSVGTTTQHVVKKKPHTLTSVRLFSWPIHRRPAQTVARKAAQPRNRCTIFGYDLCIRSLYNQRRPALLKGVHHARQTKEDAAGVHLPLRVRRIGSGAGILVPMAQQGRRCPRLLANTAGPRLGKSAWPLSR